MADLLAPFACLQSCVGRSNSQAMEGPGGPRPVPSRASQGGAAAQEGCSTGHATPSGAAGQGAFQIVQQPSLPYLAQLAAVQQAPPQLAQAGSQSTLASRSEDCGGEDGQEDGPHLEAAPRPKRNPRQQEQNKQVRRALVHRGALQVSAPGACAVPAAASGSRACCSAVPSNGWQ